MQKDRFTLEKHEADIDPSEPTPRTDNYAFNSHALGIGLEPDREPYTVEPPSPVPPTALHDGERVEYAITVFKPVGEVYSFWRDFSNIPKFMTHVRQIEVLGNGNLRWHWSTIGGFEMQWDSELIDDVPDKFLSWKTTPGSAAQHAGSVWFKPALENKATEVYVRFMYKVPGGKLTKAFAEFFGEAPEQVVKNDLRRLRCLVETGELPRAEVDLH